MDALALHATVFSAWPPCDLVQGPLELCINHCYASMCFVRISCCAPQRHGRIIEVSSTRLQTTLRPTHSCVSGLATGARMHTDTVGPSQQCTCRCRSKAETIPAPCMGEHMREPFVPHPTTEYTHPYTHANRSNPTAAPGTLVTAAVRESRAAYCTVPAALQCLHAPVACLRLGSGFCLSAQAIFKSVCSPFLSLWLCRQTGYVKLWTGGLCGVGVFMLCRAMLLLGALECARLEGNGRGKVVGDLQSVVPSFSLQAWVTYTHQMTHAMQALHAKLVNPTWREPHTTELSTDMHTPNKHAWPNHSTGAHLWRHTRTVTHRFLGQR